MTAVEEQMMPQSAPVVRPSGPPLSPAIAQRLLRVSHGTSAEGEEAKLTPCNWR